MKRLLIPLLLLALASPAFAANPPTINSQQTNIVVWPSANRVGLIVRGISGQGTNIFEVLDSNSNYLFKVEGTAAMANLSNAIVNRDLVVSNSLWLLGRFTNSALSANMPVWTDAHKGLVSLSPSYAPPPNYEFWYEPWGAGDNTSGGIGAMGWQTTSSGAGGGSINWSNSANHWGILAVSTSASANSIQSVSLGDTPNSKPWIPSLSTAVGWTNTWIWRLRQTNSVKCYLLLIGNGNYTQNEMENGMGFFINTSNSAAILAYVVTASVPSSTTLGNIVADTWYTNEMWSTSAGTVSFNLNGGTPVTRTTPNLQLTPSFGLVKTLSDGAVSLEVDEWKLVRTRDP